MVALLCALAVTSVQAQTASPPPAGLSQDWGCLRFGGLSAVLHTFRCVLGCRAGALTRLCALLPLPPPAPPGWRRSQQPRRPTSMLPLPLLCCRRRRLAALQDQGHGLRAAHPAAVLYPHVRLRCCSRRHAACFAPRAMLEPAVTRPWQLAGLATAARQRAAQPGALRRTWLHLEAPLSAHWSLRAASPIPPSRSSLVFCCTVCMN